MSDPEKGVLSDKCIIPTEDLIFSIIGDQKFLWKELMDHVQEKYQGSSGEWNYYKDGKRWLFKLVRKKKTIFWINILENRFRVTFWLSDKAVPLINDSDLPEKIRDEFSLAKKYGAIRPVSIEMNDDSDLDNVFKLIIIKQRIK
jgi:hypothetical protein